MILLFLLCANYSLDCWWWHCSLCLSTMCCSLCIPGLRGRRRELLFYGWLYTSASPPAFAPPPRRDELYLPCHAGGGLSKLAAFFAERAMGGAGLMVTGGIAPNRAGTVYPLAAKLTSSREARSDAMGRSTFLSSPVRPARVTVLIYSYLLLGRCFKQLDIPRNPHRVYFEPPPPSTDYKARYPHRSKGARAELGGFEMVSSRPFQKCVRLYCHARRC